MRRVVPLLIVLCLGFAPAPVYRERPAKSLAVKNLVGRWRIVEHYYYPDRISVDPVADGTTHVTIGPAAWAFTGPGNPSYDLRIDHGRPVAEFDLLTPGHAVPYGRGLIRREGRAIRIIYRWGPRPTGFGRQSSGWEMLLVRE
jgi:hypothetical protein